MLTDTVNTQISREIIIRGHRAVVTGRSNIRATNGRNTNWLNSPIAFFFSEYIWANIMLVLTIAAAVFKSIVQPVRTHRPAGDLFKRSLDIIGAITGLILTSPFFIVLPVLIKLDSPGPIFYRQLRVGHNRRTRERRASGTSMLGRSVRDRRRQNLSGRLFQVIKFRTMVADAEKKCGPVWATQNDPRITRLGNFLRKSRIDEIPQFINVLKGDMSLVGPRPERPVFVKDLISKVNNYEKRLQVKPGLTGLAQIENGYDSSVNSVVKKVEYDLSYIQNRSLWQDVIIMLRTVVVVITGRGAF